MKNKIVTKNRVGKQSPIILPTGDNDIKSKMESLIFNKLEILHGPHNEQHHTR